MPPLPALDQALIDFVEGRAASVDILWCLLKNTADTDTQVLRRLVYKYNRAIAQTPDVPRPDILFDIQRAAEDHLSRIHAVYTSSPRFRDAISVRIAPYQDQLSQLAAFAEGRLDPDGFITSLQTPAMKQLLALFKHGFHETYGEAIHFALYGNGSDPDNITEDSLDLSLGALINIEGYIDELLHAVAYPFKPAHRYCQLNALILSAVPDYIDPPFDYVLKHLATPDIVESKMSLAVKKKHLKIRAIEQFQSQSKPPCWIQAAEWPMDGDKPLIFIGQLPIQQPDFFHDDGMIYIFLYPHGSQRAGEFETVIQFY